MRTFKGTFVTSLRSYKRMFGRPQKTVDVPDARDYRDCAFEEVWCPAPDWEGTRLPVARSDPDIRSPACVACVLSVTENQAS